MEENIKNLVNNYKAYHSEDPELVCSCGGRFEILGNHTDHNHGLCLASACNLEIIAAVKKRKDKVVVLKSLGYQENQVDLSDLSIVELEKEHSESLIRGIAYYLNNKGYKIGGFNAYTISTVFRGAGVSSSAAFELLVGHIYNVLFNEGKIPNLVLCKAGQYAENEYFGKKSGLLDQIGVGYGGIVKIDFKNIENPDILQIQFPFKDLHFVIVNTGGDHSSLSDLYSSIPQDMYAAANEMKQRFLADASEQELEEVKGNLTEMQYLRAKHFYSENLRVRNAINALKENNEQAFLDAINGSRLSSTNNLKNMMVGNQYEGSPLEACDLVMKATENHGAVKINGGGFAGSVISVIPTKYLKTAMSKLKKKYGNENVVEIFIRDDGPKTIYKF
jgi:galactokinase